MDGVFMPCSKLAQKDTRVELTEERVRKIVREELNIWAKERAVFLSGIQPSRPPIK